MKDDSQMHVPKSDSRVIVAAMDKYDVIVVGGGPAGMMAAGFAGKRGKRVLLLEKNTALGAKLKMTGGGRCNITNAEFDSRLFLKEFDEAEQFLYSPFSQFGVGDTFKFFEGLGLPLVIQARRRAFPETEKAEDVFLALERFAKHSGVEIRTGVSVKKILVENGMVIGVKTDKGDIFGSALVLATGGVSHKETGSTGDGFVWLKELGHTVNEPSPDVVPLAVAEKWVKNLSGTSLSFMKISFYLDGVKKISRLGKILFTHFGLSGPLIMNSARHVAKLLRAGIVTAKIDAYPDTDLGALENKILRIFEANKNKDFKNITGEITPDGLDETLLTLLPEIGPDTKVHSITKEQRKDIAHTLKALPVTITNLMGFDRAVVADGGVDLREVDMRTMRSKIIPNLYLVGDILHINRKSGGYSLQICWTTGFVAGNNV